MSERKRRSLRKRKVTELFCDEFALEEKSGCVRKTSSRFPQRKLREFCFTQNQPGYLDGDSSSMYPNDSLRAMFHEFSRSVLTSQDSFYSIDDLENLFRFGLSYGVYQLEVAATGHVHAQGYVQFRYPITVQRCAELLPGAHVEPRGNFSNSEKARDYCRSLVWNGIPKTVLEGPFECGVFKPSPRHMSKDAEVIATLIETKSVEEIARENPQLRPALARTYTSWRSIREALQVVPDYRRIACWAFVGETGLGKSHYVYQHFGQANVYRVSQYNNFWANKYRGQYCLFLDEYEMTLSRSELLKVMDQYPFDCDVKNASVPANWYVVILACNEVQWDSFMQVYGRDEAVMRRFGCIKSFGGKYTGGNLRHIYRREGDRFGSNFPSMEEIGSSGLWPVEQKWLKAPSPPLVAIGVVEEVATLVLPMTVSTNGTGARVCDEQDPDLAALEVPKSAQLESLQNEVGVVRRGAPSLLESRVRILPSVVMDLQTGFCSIDKKCGISGCISCEMKA